MQCGVACAPPHLHLSSSLWPCEEVLRTRVKVTGGSRSAGWAFISGKKERGYDENGNAFPGSSSCRRSQSTLSSRLGFLGTGMLGSNELRRNLKEYCFMSSSSAQRKEGGARVHASLMVDPAVWIVRTAVFYVLLESGLAGPGRPQSISAQSSNSRGERSEDKGSLAFFGRLLGGDPEEKRKKELARTRSKWHASTKGILVRRYRVPSKAGGRKLLHAISSLLADDDTFRDVSTHKGCQIRRENAHAETVCCHNVRALFDELPTPHLVVEITVFPAGPITTAHYEKADKIEKVLRTGASI